MRYVEDRHILYVPYDGETADSCNRPVIEIREVLTKEPGALNFDHYDRYDMHGQMFFTAPGELRGVFGIHVARLTAQHGLDKQPPEASQVASLQSTPPARAGNSPG